MKPMKQLLVLLCLLHGLYSNAQTIECYPSNWWVGMKNDRLQIMLHAPNIGKASVKMQAYTGITLTGSRKVDSENYLFLDLHIGLAARPGRVRFTITHPGGGVELLDYTLQPRRAGKGTRYAQGVTSKDLMYLLIPDRFSNGDVSNDKIPGLLDQSLNRDSIFHRHGGDLKGIINHL
ncbi:MAG TPA: cyclomaltodextrinase N-terminal domain-containing protein, partial [Flavihumibacter sp.]|nr:cyclomaltodextrinase N-terminal domain-containing protein [Flavihumibacter sp.]